MSENGFYYIQLKTAGSALQCQYLISPSSKTYRNIVIQLFQFLSTYGVFHIICEIDHTCFTHYYSVDARPSTTVRCEGSWSIRKS